MNRELLNDLAPFFIMGGISVWFFLMERFMGVFMVHQAPEMLSFALLGYAFKRNLSPPVAFVAMAVSMALCGFMFLVVYGLLSVAWMGVAAFLVMFGIPLIVGYAFASRRKQE